MFSVFPNSRFIPDHLFGEEPKQKSLKHVNQYAFVEVLGRGANSKVHLAIDTDTQMAYAAKVLTLNCMKQNCVGFDREVRLLRQLQHPHIVKLHEVLYNKSNQTAYLILEWASVGSLSSLIPKGFSEATISAIFTQICCGLAFLHDHGIVHRDIKPSNILLFEGGIAKLADFGIGHSFESAETVIGSPAYQAPEVFAEDLSVELDPVKEDVWSLGVTIYETAFGKLPFEGSSVYEIACRIYDQDVDIPQSSSELLKDLLTKMLHVDPVQRLSLEEVRIHPFFQQNLTKIDVTPRIAPKVHPSPSMTDIRAIVCDENYKFDCLHKSSSWPGLYGE